MSRRSFPRTNRVSAQLRRDLGELVSHVVREHGLPSMSVSDVEVTRDLAYAKVYISALDASSGMDGVDALNDMTGELRHQLSRRLAIRTTPALTFIYDDSMDRGDRIEHLLRQVSDDLHDDESE